MKIIVKSKILILVVTLFMTVLSTYWAYSLDPVYESKALLKIGEYSILQKNGNIAPRSLDTAAGLTKELTFLFVGKGEKQGSITEIIADTRVNYMEIVSEGLTPAGSASVIRNLLSYVQDEHLKVISNNRKQLMGELKAVDDKVNTITEKQQKFLEDDEVYDDKDYSSLVNTLQLMSIIERDLGVGYIGQLLERKELLELLLGEGFDKNTALVGEIRTSAQPVTPKKMVIIFFGLFTGLFLSVATILYREDLLKRSAK